jgi:hypothetical protein
MTQPSHVIYLPPGVAAVPQMAPSNGAAGIPFDRAFFEQVLPPAVAGFCQQTNCKVPVVELLTVDGETHYVNGVAGVSDAWVALHTSTTEHELPVEIFVPYQTIFRVEIHPEMDEKRHRLGFLNPTDTTDTTSA